jgi:integrase
MTLTWAISKDRQEFVKIESINRYLKKAKAPSSYDNWKYSLYDFFEYVGIHPDEFIILERSKIEDLIESYVDSLNDRVKKKDLNPNSVVNLVLPLKKFLIFNKVEGMSDAWVRIKASFPAKIRSVDEKYTELDLQKMYNAANYREKTVLALLMSGMRIGAMPDLKVGDVKPIEDWATVKVYRGTNLEYNTFITPQGYQDILNYLDYRRRNGETITDDSSLLRNEFCPECAGKWFEESGKEHGPEPIRTAGGVASIVVGLLRRTGITKNSHNHRIRNRTMMCHGFRKYFNTICKTSGMDSERVEMLLGHVTSLSNHYWRLPSDESEMSPQEQKLFQTIKSEYRRCIPELTIGESEILKIKNQQLEETVNEQLKEKEFQIITLQKTLSKMKEHPFLGMSQDKIEGFIQMFQDWEKLKEQLPYLKQTK